MCMITRNISRGAAYKHRSITIWTATANPKFMEIVFGFGLKIKSSSLGLDETIDDSKLTFQACKLSLDSRLGEFNLNANEAAINSGVSPFRCVYLQVKFLWRPKENFTLPTEDAVLCKINL